MRTRSQMPRHTVFYKFLAVNIAVLAVFYGITLYINSLIATGQENDIEQSSLNKLELFINKVDTDINRQKVIQYQFNDRYDLQKLSVAGSRLSEYDKVVIIQRIQSDVVIYKILCEYCDNITISIPSVQREISVRPMLDYYKIADKNNEEQPGNGDALVVTGKAPDILLSSILNNPKTPIEGRPPLYSVRIDIALTKIQSDMKTYFHENTENALLLGSAGNWRISTTEKVPEDLLTFFTERKQTLKDKGALVKIKVDGVMCWVTYRYTNVMDAFFVSWRPESIITETLTSTKLTIWIVSAFTILMVLFSIFWIRRFFDEPMTQLMGALGRVEKGDLKMNIRYDRDDEFHYVYDRFNRMVVELNRLIEMNYEQRIRAQQAELKQLQYHIKPHFLYNSIFLIYRMARDGDVETIQDFSLTLGNYYRYITRIQYQTIPLAREVDHINNYIKIQSVRFGDRITVNMDPIPVGYGNLQVLPLMMQPIVENAYHHGVSEMECGGRIDIALRMENGFLTIITQDNGKGMPAEELDELCTRIMENDVADTNTGLSNVHHRLRIHFGPESGLKLEPSPLGGLMVTLNIKLGVVEDDQHSGG